MKKLLSFFAIAAMLLVVSCNKPQEFLEDEGDQASIHFSVMGELMTKANSDFATGTKVDKLKVQAFIKGSDNAYHLTNANITITPVTGASPLAWDVDMKLAKNRAYKIAFFAYKDGTGIYGVDDLSAITVDYSKIAINSDDADAFCAARSLTVAGALSETVELYRPLAQLNIGVSDWEEYKNSTLDEMQDITVAISVNSVPNGLNLIGGETAADGSVAATTSGAGAVEFARVDVLDVDDELVTGYDYFSMVYVLASKDKENMTFTADFEFGDETSVDISNIEITNMPYQANYRTNVLGQLLTGNIHYDVEIVPGFMTPDYVATMIEQAVETSSDLAAAMAANKDVTSQEYEVNEVVKDNADANTATIEIPDNTTSTSITFDLNSVKSGVTEIIIKDENPANEETNYKNTVIIEVPASVDLDNVTVTVNAPNAHVILKQGDYSTVVASTSGNTLVVEAGATVDLLKVKAGNVKIEAGATVTSIVREAGNADAKTLVIMEQGATWTNMAAEKGAKLVVVAMREGFSFDGAAYHVESKVGLANFRDMVNGGEMPEGMTVELDTDLDMTGVEWTPIGVESYTNNFRGVFDGKGHTISNLSVTHVKTAGLFGTLCGNATIKNLNMKDVALRSNHYAGGIVAWVEQGGSPVLVDNCSVDGGSIVSEPEKVGSEYDNGDKIGGIVGFAYAGQYTNNSACNLTLTAYRDLAGVAGYAKKAIITGNSVSNVIVNQSNKNAYKAEPVTTFAEIVGRDGGENTIENNTASDVTLCVDGCTKSFDADGNPVYAVSAAATEAVLGNIMADINANPYPAVTFNLADDAVLTWITGPGAGSTPLLNAENTVTETVTFNGGTFMATGAGVGAVRAANGGKLVFNEVTIIDRSVSYTESSWEYGYLEIAGNLEFNKCEFTSAIQLESSRTETPGTAKFDECTFTTETESASWVPTPSNMYCVWISNDNAVFTKCEFTGFRGLKMHEAYGSDVLSVTIDGCNFHDLSKKPGIAIGTLNDATIVSITNSIFSNCQAGDQELYSYETDTNVDNICFTYENNTIVND